MASWQEFAAAQPEMAALGLKQLQKFGLGYLATTRKDGMPRVNPVCPVIADGRLFIATRRDSPKIEHLVNDGRYMLHLLPGKEEEEFWVSGVAASSADPPLRARVIVAAEGITRITDDEDLFEYDISEAGTTVWLDFGTLRHRPFRKFWHAP